MHVGMGWFNPLGWGCLIQILLDVFLWQVDITKATRFKKVVFNTHASSIVNKEYCVAEHFEPSCSETSEVISILKADYGRMNLGRCVTEDSGNLGCTSNQLGLFDQLCSGRRQCRVLVPTPEMKASGGCSKALVRYLDVSYRCQKVLEKEKLSCDVSMAYSLSGPSGLLSSMAVLEANCDDQAASFMLEIHDGQSINFTLIDYGWNTDRLTAPSQSCNLPFGYIAEVDTFDIINICGGTKRIKHVATVKAKKVQIVLKPMSEEQPQFVLKYEVIGCPKPKLPSKSWSKQDGHNLVVGCDYSGNKQRWKLMCQGNTWIGTLGDCIQPVVHIAKSKQQVSGDETSPNSNKQSVLTANGALILIIVGSCTVAIILIVILVGVVCIKRQSPKRKKKKLQKAEEKKERKKRKPKKNCPPLPPKSAVLRPPNSNRNSTATYKSVCLEPADGPMMQSLISEPCGSLKYEHIMRGSVISDGSGYEHPMFRSYISTDGSMKYDSLMTRSLMSDGTMAIERPPGFMTATNRNSLTAVRTTGDQPEYFILERPVTIINN